MTSPIALIAPAMAVGSWFYGPLRTAFEERGWDVDVLPRRGFEPGEPQASPHQDWSYIDEAEVVVQAVAEARSEKPDRPVIIIGHSLGGHLGAAVQLGDQPADALITIGTSNPHFRYYGIRSVGLLALAAAVGPAAKLKGYVPKPFFGAPGARTLMSEWASMIRTGEMPFPVEKLIDTPALSIHLQGDAYSVKSAVRHFEHSSFSPESLTTWTYLKSDTPPEGTTHHVYWARQPEVVVEYIVSWWDEQNSDTKNPDATSSDSMNSDTKR